MLFPTVKTVCLRNRLVYSSCFHSFGIRHWKAPLPFNRFYGKKAVVSTLAVLLSTIKTVGTVSYPFHLISAFSFLLFTLLYTLGCGGCRGRRELGTKYMFISIVCRRVLHIVAMVFYQIAMLAGDNEPLDYILIAIVALIVYQ